MMHMICGIVLITGVLNRMDQNNRYVTLEKLRTGREAASTAFMEFTSKRKYHIDHAFCFYEGEDGKYYDHRIRSIFGNDFFHIKAGNKSKVLKVMKLIKDKPEYQSVITMFFVDRDMGFDLEEYKENDVYVTPCYSVENLYVNEESFGMILETEFGLNTYDTDYDKYKKKFVEMYHDFCELMLEFNALILIRKEKNLDCGKVNIQRIKTSDLITVDIYSGVSKSSKYSNTITELKEKLDVKEKDGGITLAVKRLLEHGEKSNVFRGKNQFDYMTKFIEQLCNRKDELFAPVPTSINISPNQNRLSTYSIYAKTPECLKTFLQAHRPHNGSAC